MSYVCFDVFASKTHGKTARRNQVAFLGPLFALWQQNFHVASSARTNSVPGSSQKFGVHFLFCLICSDLTYHKAPECQSSFPAATGKEGVRVIPCVLKIPYSQRTTLLAKKPTLLIQNLAPVLGDRQELFNMGSKNVPADANWQQHISVILCIYIY